MIEKDEIEAIETWLHERMRARRAPIGGASARHVLATTCDFIARDLGIRITSAELAKILPGIGWGVVHHPRAQDHSDHHILVWLRESSRGASPRRIAEA